MATIPNTPIRQVVINDQQQQQQPPQTATTTESMITQPNEGLNLNGNNESRNQVSQSVSSPHPPLEQQQQQQRQKPYLRRPIEIENIIRESNPNYARNHQEEINEQTEMDRTYDKINELNSKKRKLSQWIEGNDINIMKADPDLQLAYFNTLNELTQKNNELKTFMENTARDTGTMAALPMQAALTTSALTEEQKAPILGFVSAAKDMYSMQQKKIQALKEKDGMATKIQQSAQKRKKTAHTIPAQRQYQQQQLQMGRHQDNEPLMKNMEERKKGDEHTFVGYGKGKAFKSKDVTATWGSFLDSGDSNKRRMGIAMHGRNDKEAIDTGMQVYKHIYDAIRPYG
jgi:hypothetical protein